MVKKRKALRDNLNVGPELVRGAGEPSDGPNNRNVVDAAIKRHEEDEPKSRANGDGEGERDGEEDDGDEGDFGPTEQQIEEWNALKEEHHEIIEQLPLSLYRSMALLRELDDQVQESQEALLPAIRKYIATRRTFAEDMNPDEVDAPPLSVSILTDEQMKVDTPEAAVVESPQEETDGQQKAPSVTSEHRHSVVEGSSSTVEPILARLLRPPNPFLQRSHSSFSLPSVKDKEEKIPPGQTREMLKHIASLAQRAVDASEEKVGVATAVYNSVDRHVRALDAVIKEHENSLLFGLRPGTRPTNAVLPAGDAAILAAGDEAEQELSLGMAGSAGAISKPRRRRDERKRNKDRRERRKKASEAAALGGSLDKPPPEVEQGPPTVAETPSKFGMPVDPHEPRYCYCQNVSYGEMIGCDNENCANEWFHLGCTGLKEPPKPEKKWYCRDCAPMFERPSKKKR